MEQTEEKDEATLRREELELECERAKVLTREDSYDLHAWDSADPQVGPAIWMEGVPDWIEQKELSDTRFDKRCGWDDTHVYRTAWVCELFGEEETPPGWERVESYTHSGETECYCRDSDEATAEGGVPGCTLCEGDGLIYVGEGYREVIYRAPKGLFWPEDHCTRCGHDLEHLNEAEGSMCVDTKCMRGRIENTIIFHRIDANLTHAEYVKLVDDLMAQIGPKILTT